MLLGNALEQSGWKGSPPTEGIWRGILRDRVKALDWGSLTADVGPFLEPGTGTELMTGENLELVLGAEP